MKLRVPLRVVLKTGPSWGQLQTVASVTSDA